LRNKRENFGQQKKSARCLTPLIPSVALSTKVRLQETDMSTKIESAKAWLGERWIGHEPK
jgi:hypothetical protein